MRRIGGIILAAGGSTRMGEPKQLLEFHGESLEHAAVRAAQRTELGRNDRIVTIHDRQLQPFE